MDRPKLRVVGPVLGAPDPHELARFYARFLGWPVVEQEGPGVGDPGREDWAKLRSPAGELKLEFQLERGYRRPVWPPTEGEQQLHSHLDIETDDLAAAVSWALECGAVLAAHQPQAGVRVLLDPAGQVFCLFSAGG